MSAAPNTAGIELIVVGSAASLIVMLSEPSSSVNVKLRGAVPGKLTASVASAVMRAVSSNPFSPLTKASRLVVDTSVWASALVVVSGPWTVAAAKFGPTAIVPSPGVAALSAASIVMTSPAIVEPAKS